MIINTRPLDRHRSLQDHFPDDVIASPMLKVRVLSWEERSAPDVDAYIFTSQTAVNVAATHMRDRCVPVLAVGPATAGAAERHGFDTVLGADGTAEGLLRLIDSLNFKTGIYFSAIHISKDLAAARPSKLKRQAIYDMDPAEGLSQAAFQLIESGQAFIVPFYSPRTLEVFERLVRRDGLETRLSNATAILIRGRLRGRMTLGWGNVRIANQPNEQNMISEIKVAA